ncbi:MAG: FadD3 family acyl-CoA ligase [Rhodococcus sp. (in: high G+C Gram-positive bacteria)]
MKVTGDTVPAALARVAHTHADRPAVLDGDTALSWSELSDRVHLAAAGLLALGVDAGDAVAFWSPNTWHWMVGALAAHHVGAAVVPINTRYTGAEAQDVLARTGARVLLVAGTFLGTDRSDALDFDLLPDLAALVRIRIEPDDAGPARPGPAVHGWEALGGPRSGAELDRVREYSDAVTPTTVADILFTSGTTGRSKAVACSHGQSLASSLAWARCAELTHEDRYLVVNPFFHSFGYKAGILTCLQTGAMLIPHATFDPARVLQTIEARAVTVLPGPPTLYRTLLDHPDRGSHSLNSLRIAVTGAATVPVSLIDEMGSQLCFDTVLTAYGLTESGGFATMCRPGDDTGTVSTTSGRAMGDYEVSIAETGEVLVRGPGVMHGYLDDDAATEATLDADGWLHTGDIGSMDERGNLRITDRLKDMYICGGFNVYPAEVEQRILTLGGIREVAVIGTPDTRLGEVGAAIVVLDPSGSAPSEAEIIEHCRGALANFKVPRAVHVRSELPRNASGKVLKNQLREELS